MVIGAGLDIAAATPSTQYLATDIGRRRRHPVKRG